MQQAIRDPVSGSVLLSPAAAGHLGRLLPSLLAAAGVHHGRLPGALAEVLHVLAPPVAPVAAAGSTQPGSKHLDGGTASVLSAPEAARRVGCDGWSVRRAAARGTLRATKVDGRWLVTEQALTEWQEAWRVGRTSVDRVDRDEAELRAMVAEVETALADIEQEMATLNHRREVEQAVVAAADAGGFSPLQVWKAEEAAARLAHQIADLADQARPLNDRRSTAMQILGPLDRRRADAARQRIRVEAQEQLADIPALIDQVIAKFDQAADTLRAGRLGVNVEIPKRLRDLVTDWRAGQDRDHHGPARWRFEDAINPAAAKERLASIERGD